MIDNQSAEQPDPVQEKASSEGGMAGLLRLKLKDDGPGDMVSMLGRLGVSPERLKAPRTDLTGDEQNQLFIEGVDRAFDSGEYNPLTLGGPMVEATMKQVGIPDAISEFTGGVIGEINALLNFRGQLLNTATNWTTGKDYDEVLPGWLYKAALLPSNPGMSGADAIEAQLPEGMSAQERMASIGGESVARDLGGAGTQVMTAIGLSLIPGGQAAAAANTARAAGVVGRLLGPVKQFVKSPGGKLYMGYMGGRQMAESSKEYREYVENQNKYADMYNEALDYLELPFDKIDKDEYSLATDVMTSVGSGAMTAASELIGTGFSVMAGRRIGSRLLPSVFKGNVADRVAYRGMGGLIAQMAKGGVTASAMEGFEEVVDGFGQAVIRGWYSEFERGRFLRTGDPGDLWKTLQQHFPDLAYQFAIAATVTLPLGIGGSLAVARRDNRTLEAFAEARLRDRLAEGEGVESGVADHVASKVIYDHAMGQGDKDQVAIRAAVQQLRGRMEEVGNVTEDMLMDPEFAARFVEAFPELAFKIGQSESLSRTQLQWLTGQNTTSSGARQAFLDRVRRGSNDQVGAYVAEWVRRADTRLKEIRGRLAELNQDNSEEGRSERTKLSYEASRIQSVREGFEDLIAAREQISGEEFRQAVEGLSVSLEGIDPTGSADATQDSRATEQYESGIPDQEGPTSADLRRLARQGDSDAALELARRHETGDRAEPHEAKARYWFNVALSQAGDTDAMVYLGMVYEGRIQAESPGAPRSINKARDLYRRAFEMGNDEAGRLLGELEQRLAGPAPRARADAATSRSGPSAGVQTPQAPRTPRTPREAPAVQSVPEAAPETGSPQAAPERPSKPRKPKGFSASKKPPAEVRNEDIYEEMQEDMSRREQARQEQQAQQEAEARAAEQRRLDEELTAEEQRLNEEVAKGAKRDDLRVRIVGRDTDTPLQKKVRAAAKKLGRKVEFIRITQEQTRPGQRRRRSPSGIRGFVSRNGDTIYIVAVTENQASRLEQDVLKDHYLQTLLHEVAHGFVQDKTIREQVEQLLTKELADSFRSRFMLGDTAEEIKEELAVYTLTQDIVGSRGVESLIMGSESFKAFRKVADSLVGVVEAILPKNQRAQLLKRVLKDRVTVTKKAKEVSKDNPAREVVEEGRTAKPQPKPQAKPKIAARQETKPTQEDRTSPQPKPVWQMTSAEFLREFEFVKGMGSTSSPWGVVRDGQSVQGSAVQAKDGTGRKISVRPYFFKTKKAAVESMRELHRQSVEGAIRNGRDVPSNVRAELETKPTPTREATTREPAARPKATPPQESRPNQDGPPVARARLKTEEGFVPDKFRPELQKGSQKQSSIVDVGIPGHRLILYPETSKAERDRIAKEFSKPYSRRRGASRLPSASPQVAASLRGIKPANGPAFIKLTKRLANPLRDHVRVQGGKMIVLEGQDSPTNVLGVTATRVGHEFSSQSFGKISDGVYRIEGGKLVEPTAREESIPGSQIFNEVDGTRLSMDIDADALLADIGKVLAIMGSSATTDLSSIALSVNPDRSIGMAALVTNEKGDIVGVSETNIQEGSKAVGAVFGQSLLDTARLHTAAGATKFTLRMNNKVLELSSIGSEGTIGRSHLMLMKSDTRSIEDRLRSEGVRFMREISTAFSGIGSWEMALRDLVSPGMAVESDLDTAAAYAIINDGRITVDDVRNVPTDFAKDSEIFCASPVCKSYSQANRQGGEQDLDIATAKWTASVIRDSKPPIVMIENVPEYATRSKGAYTAITKALEDGGYTWDAKVYKASDFGAATTRSRLIIRAVRDGELPPSPKATHGIQGTPVVGWMQAAGDLVSSLPESKMPQDSILSRRLKEEGGLGSEPLLLMGSPPSQSSQRQGIRVSRRGDEPAFTIKATSKEVIRVWDGKTMRRATPRFLARLHGIPDSVPLPQKQPLAKTVIGNGIPLPMVRAVAAPLLERSSQTQGTLFMRERSDRPAADGMTRLYRVQLRPEFRRELPADDWRSQAMRASGTTDAQGRWFFEDATQAEFYLEDIGRDRAEIVAVDVPTADLDKYRVSNVQPDGIVNPRRFSARGMADQEFFLPRDLASQAQPTGDIRFMRERFNKASIRRLLDSISALDESGAIRTAMFWEMSNLERAIQRYREELGELADDLNPAELYQLAGGKRIDMVERFDREEIRPFEEKVADLAKRSGMSELEVRDLIQEYAYVVHARDANTELQQRSETERRARAQAKRNGVTEVLEGDELEAMLEQMSKLGISNEEAIERQKQLDAEFDRIGGDWAGAVEMLRSMNRRTLEMRRDAGLITQASYDTLIKRYPSYVPIVRSVFGEEGEVDAGTSRPKKREMRSLRGGNEATGRTFWAASYAITKHDRLVTAHRIAMNEGHMAFWELAMQGALKMQDGTSLADAVFVDQIVQDAVRRARAAGSTRTGEDGKPVKASEFDQGVEVGKAITEATADIDSRMMRGENESPDTVRFKLTRDVDLTDPQVLRDIEDVTSSKDGLTSEERAEGMKPRTQKQREKKLEQLERQKLVYKKGSAMHFRINDPILANAMLNRTPTMMQRAQEKGGLVGKMSNAWMALMNYQRFAYVTASPGFIVGEMFRSPQQVAIMARVLADKYRLPREQAEQLFRNLELEYAKMFFTVPVVGAARSAPFVSSSWKSVKHVLKGGKPRDEYEELIAEAIEAGVLQGGIFNVDSYEQMSAKLRREIADLADGTTKSHRKHGRLSKAGQFAGWVEMVTTALDMSNRMQLYRAAREAGLSKQKAAVMARESTIDFGKKGSFNRGANELYLFFNPRMQGIHQLLRAFKQTSRGRLSTTAAVLGRYFLYAFLLKMVVEMFFEDDENPDTWLGKFASMQNTIIPIPGTESENGQYMYFEINNPYGFGAIAKLAYRFGDVLMGDSRPGDLIVGGVGDVMSELTPVQFDGMQLLKGKREGLESFLAAVTPTNFQPLVSAFMNRDWKGAPIAPLGPEFGAGENRESLDYWPDTMRTSIWASQGIAELTGVIMRALQGPQARGVEISPNKLGYIFERYLPGVARQFGDLIKTVGQMSDGTRRGIGSVPVVNLVIGQSGGRSVLPGRFRDLDTIATNAKEDIKADGVAPTLKRYGNLSWLAGPEFSAAKRQLKKLQEARNNATERGDRVRATKLEDRMNEIRKRMLIRAAKMRNR